MLENIEHRRTRVGAIARIALDVELALVAEGAVEAGAVHAGGGAEIVERGRRESVLWDQIERLAERDFGLVGARPAAAFWCDGGSGFCRRRRSSRFLYHFAINSLTTRYIMRDSIKINRGPKHRTKPPRRLPMDLYFSPLASSLATRIPLYEAAAEPNSLEAAPKPKVVQH